MPFTYMIIEKGEERRLICPLNEKTQEPYTSHTYDAETFIKQFLPGVIIEVSEPGHMLKKDLEEAKRLLEIAKNKLCSPGRYETFANEIERFLNK